MIRVMLCDDHVLVRAGLIQVLSAQPDLEVVGEAGDGPALIRLLQAKLPDVVLLDIALPGRDGLDALQQIGNAWPRLPVLILSTYPEKQYAVRCLRLGASGYLNKTADPETLAAAIRKLASGRSYVSAGMAESLAGALQRRPDGAPHESLSTREYQVFLQIARGRTAAQIATELSLSPNTVGTYRARVMEKIQTRNDVETALYAVRHGLAGTSSSD